MTDPEQATTSPQRRALQLEHIVRQHADASESQRHLHPEVAHAFAESGLYRIAAPSDFFGEEADPMAQVATIETVSRFDGSAGWNLMIGIESFGLIAPAFANCRDLIADPLVVMCSSTAAVGTAEKTTDGYRVSGQWQFVSGCHNSILFGATVKLQDGGRPLPDLPNMYAIVAAPEFQILDTWHVGGLCGSGSHDVRI